MIPFIGRIVIVLFVVVLLVCGSTILVAKSSAKGYGCLENYDTVLDAARGQTYSKWVYNVMQGLRYPVTPIQLAPRTIFLGSPAYSWLQHGTSTAHLEYRITESG